MIKIDPKSIDMPEIEISKDAASQIQLALENDPYNANKTFRVHISGKGCDGFSYNTFFDHEKSDDIKIPVGDITILMAPFTAYYSSKIKIDYVWDDENELEGFLVENLKQKNFSGKFWREHPERTPNIVTE